MTKVDSARRQSGLCKALITVNTKGKGSAGWKGGKADTQSHKETPAYALRLALSESSEKTFGGKIWRQCAEKVIIK